MLSLPTVFRRTAIAAGLLLISCFIANAENRTDWTGIYYTKKHLNGQAYFQLGIQQSGNAMRIVFNAAYNDGHGPAPEGQGSAKPMKEWKAGSPAGKDTLEFQFQDSCKNTGSGTIKRAGDHIIVDFIFANAADKSCMDFYGRGMHLRRAGKK